MQPDQPSRAWQAGLDGNPGQGAGVGEATIGISGYVTRADGSPVSGASLTLTDLQGRQLAHTRTGSGGDYALVPATGGGSYIVICLGPGHRPQAALVAVGAESVRHDVALLGAGGVQGRVRVAGTDTGATGATVALLDVHGTVVAATGTGPDGEYAFSDLAEGDYTLSAGSASHQPVAVSVAVAPGRDQRADLELAERARLTGTVVAASSGHPVEEALVTVIDADGAVLAATATGPDGVFGFEDLRAGTYTVTATGYAPVATQVTVDPGQPCTAEIELKPPHSHD